jgi:glycosyltransferase involved in cell wall biosynthesis
MADGYIFSSNQLCKRFNSQNKPYVICMGTYNAEDTLSTPIDDGKTHIVYAGTFNPHKGGVFNAISATEYLDSSYHLHILGGADEKLFKLVAKAIIEASLKTECQITYDGFLTGDEYKSFLQSCHIGLSTQDSEGAFNNSSFPSKILVYLANGLKVVSSKIPAVTTSMVDSAMYYYDYQAPREIARAIKDARENDKCDPRELVDKLNRSFIEDIKILLGL